MKSLISTALLIVSTTAMFSQITWSGEIASIFYENCTSCHRDGGIGPFSLMTYEEASDYSSGLDDVVSSGEMPPWSPDPGYQDYTHERILDPSEIDAIVEWVNNNTPVGNIDDAPPPPIYPADGYIPNTPDVEVQIPTYTSQATEFSDDYVCFSIPLELTESKKLRAFEVIPGNPEIVHHCLLYIDESGSYQTDLSGFCVGPTDGLIGGYTPGAVPTIFPSNNDDLNTGFTIPAGSNIVLAMHYPEGSSGETDDTKVRLFFYDDDVVIREIHTDPIIQDWDFVLPAESETSVSASWDLIPIDVSLISVFPHMHLLGENIESYGITPNNDILPFISISEWDFEWQQFYGFQYMQHVPAWTVIHGEGTFNNPNSYTVYPGLNTEDEMFIVYFQYLAYVAGDELIDLEDLTTLPTVIEEPTPQQGDHLISTYPNPFETEVTFEFNIDHPSKISLFVYDLKGNLVGRVLDRQLVVNGTRQVKWNVPDDISSGAYFYSARINGLLESGMIIKR